MSARDGAFRAWLVGGLLLSDGFDAADGAWKVFLLVSGILWLVLALSETLLLLVGRSR